MGTLDVTEYRVGVNRSRAHANAHRYFLQLMGASAEGDARSAIVYFSPARPVDAVGYMEGNLLVGMLDDGDFADWCDILSNEKPVRMHYVENSSDPQRRLQHISIGTMSAGVSATPAAPEF